DMLAMTPQPAAGLDPGRLAPIQVPDGIAGQNVRVFVYYTTSLASFNLTNAQCPDIAAVSQLATDGGVALGDGGAQLIQTLDFDVSDTLPASMITATGKYIFLAQGCPLSSQPALVDSILCGLPADAGGAGDFTGDFHVYALGLDTSDPPAGKVNVQGVNALYV